MILQPPQVDVGADLARTQNQQQIFGQRFNHNAMPDGLESLIANGNEPAAQGWALFVLDDVVHVILPRTFCDCRIGAGQIGHPNLPVEQRMALGFVFVEHQTFSFCPVFGLQAGARPGDDVFAIERAAPVAELNQTFS